MMTPTVDPTTSSGTPAGPRTVSRTTSSSLRGRTMASRSCRNPFRPACGAPNEEGAEDESIECRDRDPGSGARRGRAGLRRGELHLRQSEPPDRRQLPERQLAALHVRREREHPLDHHIAGGGGRRTLGLLPVRARADHAQSRRRLAERLLHDGLPGARGAPRLRRDGPPPGDARGPRPGPGPPRRALLRRSLARGGLLLPAGIGGRDPVGTDGGPALSGPYTLVGRL